MQSSSSSLWFVFLVILHFRGHIFIKTALQILKDPMSIVLITLFRIPRCFKMYQINNYFINSYAMLSSEAFDKTQKLCKEFILEN